MGGIGGPISELRVRGRLNGVPLGGKPEEPARHTLHFMTLMGCDYDNNSAYQFGGQDFSGAFTSDWRFTPAWRLVTTASGGFLPTSFAPYGAHYVSTLGSVTVGDFTGVNVIGNVWVAGIRVFFN